MAKQARQVRPEVPRWQKKRKPAAPQIVLSKAAEKRVVRQVAAQLSASQPSPAQAVPPAAARGRLTVRRFRYQLVPAWLLVLVLAAGPGLRYLHHARAGVVTGLMAGLLTWLATRHLAGTGRLLASWLSLLLAAWIPLFALAGWTPPWPPLFLCCWAVLAWRWWAHYRWRAGEAPAMPGEPALSGDLAIWGRLAAKNKWAGRLGPAAELPGGGKQYPVALDGVETHIGHLLQEPLRIAAAWHMPITQAYVEPDPAGDASRGRLTILRRNSLAKSRAWDGTGIDLATGLAVIGRFPDGQPVHERYFVPRNGIAHTLVAGATGSGKSSLLNLGLCQSAGSGIIAPVILDPQEGQALPDWPEFVPYARGTRECLAYLCGLHAAMLERSRDLSQRTWVTGDGEQRKGMGFFDAALTGLPVIEITLDEAPVLLTSKEPAAVFGDFSGLGFRKSAAVGEIATYLLAEIGKLGRKAGFRIRLAVQVPSLAELGNSQAMRSMLVGGNVFCGRTGDKVTQGMIGVAADPSQIAKYFADGSPTVCLGYADGPDNRPATPMRWDWVPDPYAFASKLDIRVMDDQCAAAMAAAMASIVTAAELPLSRGPAPLAAVPDDDGDSDAPEGRKCADACLAALREGGTMSMGEIALAVRDLAAGWGRKPWHSRTVRLAMEQLVKAGTVVKPAGHNSYAIPRTTLTIVGGSGGSDRTGMGA